MKIGDWHNYKPSDVKPFIQHKMLDQLNHIWLYMISF